MANNNDGNIHPEVQLEIDSISFSNGLGGHNNKKIFTLGMLGRPLSEADMVAIAGALCQSTQVEVVRLDRCLNCAPAEATAAFLKKILATHPSIKEMNLTSNGIKTGLAEVIGFALQTNTSLKVLNLFNNNVGPGGAVEIAEGLSHNKVLQLVNLSSNQLGDRGAAAFAKVLCISKTLEVLNLDNNGVTGEGGKALASALEKSSLKKLILSFNPALKQEGGKAIAKSLGKNKSMIALYLFCTDVGDETCLAISSALCNNSSLTELDLRFNQRITRAGAAAIEDSLKYLNYAIERVSLGLNDNVPDDQRSLIHRLCNRNIRIKAFFQQVTQNVPAIPLGVWPKVLEAVECKPDLLYALLKTKPDMPGPPTQQPA